jgi:hypothetical protein
MNAVESFNCLVKQEYIALLHSFFNRIIEDFLNTFYSCNYFLVDLLTLDILWEELDDGIQLEDQVADFFYISAWDLKVLDISLKMIQCLCDFLLNKIIHLNVD